MKVCFLMILAFTTVGFYACEKQKSEPNFEQQLIGNWELKFSRGGFIGETRPAEDGKRSVLAFNSKGNYQQLENGNIVKHGKYAFSTIESIYSGQIETALLFNEVDPIANEVRKYVVSLRKDSLFLSDNYYDGYSTLYLRVK